MSCHLHPVALIGVLVALTLMCGDSNSRAQILPFDHFTTASGLSSNATNVLFQDARGFLHIGSSEGLSTFDGYTFTHTRTREGLPSNYVYVIAERSAAPGILWVGTANGIGVVDGRTVRSLLLDTTDLSRLVYSIQEDRRGRMWCGTHGGLYVVTGDSVDRVTLPPGTPGSIEVFPRGSDSVIWVLATKFLLAFTPDKRIALRTEVTAAQHNPVSGALRDLQGRIWIGHRDGTLSVYDNGVLVHQRLLPATRVNPIMVDRHGRMYLATESGVITFAVEEFPHGQLSFMEIENGLPGRLVQAGVVDSEGDLWFALEGSGVARLRSCGLLQFPIPHIYEAYNNMRAASDSAGHYWVISGPRLVEVWQSSAGRWQMSSHNIDGLGRIAGVLCTGGNVLLLSLRNGAVRRYSIHYSLDGPSTLRQLGTASVHPVRSQPRTLLWTKSGRLWWTDSTHLVVSNGNWRREFPLEDLVGEKDVRALFEDSKGNIWVGGFSKGVAIIPADFETVAPRRLVPHGDIPAGFIRAFSEDGFGRIWVGTRYAGCMIISEEGIRVLSAADVLPSDAVWTITRDHRGTMWLGTSEGIVAVDPSTVQPNPIGNNLVRDPVASSGVARDGTIWFVTPSGFGIIEPDRLPVSSVPVTVQLARLEVNGQPVEMGTSFVFPHTQNNCTFTFLASTLRNAREVLYQYRLVGADHDWQQPTRQRTVAYASLQPGTYRFEVRATRGGALPFGPTAGMTFTINPPFWGTWWFRASVLLIIAGMLYFVRRRKIEQLRRETKAQQEFSRQLLESQENERKRIAGELHDSLVQDLLVAKNRSLMGLKNVQDPERVGRELEGISSALSSAIEEVREIAHNLRPYQLDRLGFSKAVRSLVVKLAESTSIRIAAEIDDVDGDLNGATSIHLYRILQEALNNVLKHSNASSALVTLKRDGSSIRLCISDDGRGLSLASTRAKGFGLDNIAQRANLIGASFEITSGEGKGTTLQVTIPIQQAPHGREDESPYR